MNNGMGFDEWNDGEILFVLRRRTDFPPSIPLDRNNNQTHELFARIPVNFSMDLYVLSDFAKFPRENRSWDEFNDEFDICKNWWKNFLLFFPEIVSPWARMLIKRILILGLAILISERFNFNPIFFQPVAKHIEVDIKEITRI